MAVEEADAVRWVCDGCGKAVLVDLNEVDAPDWFSGTANRGQYDAGDWVACRAACIKGAVISALSASGKN